MIKEVLKRLEVVAGLDKIETVADDDWFKKLDRQAQREYIKRHPKSKFAHNKKRPAKNLDRPEIEHTCKMCGHKGGRDIVAQYGDGVYLCRDCAEKRRHMDDNM